MAPLARVSAELRAHHAAVYATLGLPGFRCWPVADRLYAGRQPLTEIDVLQMIEAGVTDVLDLREPREWHGVGLVGADAVAALERRGLARRNVAIEDASAPSPGALEAAVGWIDTVLARPGRTLFVHCRAGVERTGSVLAAWRCQHTGESIDAALAALGRRGWPGRPLPHQRAAVEAWLGSRSEL